MLMFVQSRLPASDCGARFPRKSLICFPLATDLRTALGQDCLWKPHGANSTDSDEEQLRVRDRGSKAKSRPTASPRVHTDLLAGKVNLDTDKRMVHSAYQQSNTGTPMQLQNSMPEIPRVDIPTYSYIVLHIPT